MWLIRYGMRAPPRWWVDKIRLPAQYNRPEDSHGPGLRLRSPHRPPSYREQQVAEVRQGRAPSLGGGHGLRLTRARRAGTARARRAPRLRLRVRGAGVLRGGGGPHPEALRLARGPRGGGAPARRDRGAEHGGARLRGARRG